MQILVTGFSRSGTTLLQLILRETLKDHRVPDGERSWKSLDLKHCENGVAKRPLDSPTAKDFLEAAPNPLLILCVRDPRDVLTSTHKRAPNDWFIDADKQWKLGNTMRKVNPGLLEQWDGIKGLIGRENVITIHYEVLTQDPDYVHNQLRLAGLRFSKPFSFTKLDDVPPRLNPAVNVTQIIDKGRFGRWKEYRERVNDQFERFPRLYEILDGLGYEREEKE